MEYNLLALLVAALSSCVVAFLWYNPKVFGSILRRESRFSQQHSEKENRLKIFGLTFIYSFMLAIIMPMLVIHQSGALGMIGGQTLIETAKPSYAAFMADYGDAFRTYKHGALHGFLSGIFLALPIVSINGLFERKSWKYMAVQAGYWTVTLTIMGAIICGWK